MADFKTLKKHAVLDAGRFLKVERHEVEAPDGSRIDDWAWVITPEYVNAVVVTDRGEFVLFEQTKYGIDGLSLAPVGGYIEPDENPLAAAQRETLEETGYQAAQWHPLGSYVPDANRGCGRAHLFLATGAQRVAEPDADDLEEQTLLLLSDKEVRAALKRGRFKVLAWITVVSLALQVLDESL